MEKESRSQEMGFMDYLLILWKKKWLTIVPTVVSIIIVGIFGIISPSRWEVDAILMSSKILTQNDQGDLQYIMLVEPGEIAGLINKSTYNQRIAEKLDIDVRTLPRIRAENMVSTDIVRMYLNTENANLGRSILSTLYNLLKEELDAKAEIELNTLNSEIASREAEKEHLEKDVLSIDKKLIIVKKRINELQSEMKSIRDRIAKLAEVQDSNLRNNRSESETMGMLLYSNEIQQSLMYHNTLNEMLGKKQFEEENLRMDVEQNKTQIKIIENNISILSEKKGRVDFSRMVKQPTVSIAPVNNIFFNMVLAGLLTLFVFVFLSIILYSFQSQKSHLS